MWTGLFSFCIVASFDSTGYLPDVVPKWVELLEKEGLLQSWLSGIMTSTMTSFSPLTPHISVFLELLPKADHYIKQPSVEWFCSFHVPVWYP